MDKREMNYKILLLIFSTLCLWGCSQNKPKILEKDKILVSCNDSLQCSQLNEIMKDMNNKNMKE